jgi:hypothetical protein
LSFATARARRLTVGKRPNWPCDASGRTVPLDDGLVRLCVCRNESNDEQIRRRQSASRLYSKARRKTRSCRTTFVHRWSILAVRRPTERAREKNNDVTRSRETRSEARLTVERRNTNECQPYAELVGRLRLRSGSSVGRSTSWTFTIGRRHSHATQPLLLDVRLLASGIVVVARLAVGHRTPSVVFPSRITTNSMTNSEKRSNGAFFARVELSRA